MEEIEKQTLVLCNLLNRGEYLRAHRLATKLVRDYPKVLRFAYYEAVLTAEQHDGFTSAQIKRRQNLAARKLRPLLRRLKGSWRVPIGPEIRISWKNIAQSNVGAKV